MATFIGLDLAWTAHHESGVCVLHLDEGRLRCARLDTLVGTTGEFTALAREGGEDTVVAIDAPLIVGEQRQAERALGRVFGKYRAGAYTATPSFLERMGGMAGPRLGEALRAGGFSLDPAALGTARRVAIEVYPHAAHVVLFRLAERLKYKKGPLGYRRAGLRTYQGHLGALLAAHGELIADRAVRSVLDPESVCGGGQNLKRLEDRLDALTCAYVAYHVRTQGPAATRVFGDAESGYIVVPWVEGFA